jgi:hypothetical protein
MSQYLSLLLSWLAFFRQNPEAAVKLWQAAVTMYEAAQVLINEASDTFGQIMARESAAVLTPDEEEAERQFNEAFSTARGPFGNGKILRWLMTSEEGKALLAALKTKIPGMGS